MSGYSGTPLIRKLGLKPGMRVAVHEAPRPYEELLTGWPDGARLVSAGPYDFVHLFAVAEAGLADRLTHFAAGLDRSGMIWLSWPKKASRVTTDLDEGKIRRLGLAAGLVDVKVCAVDEVWSGLKFVFRLKDR
jgi:hypothetical protein